METRTIKLCPKWSANMLKMACIIGPKAGNDHFVCYYLRTVDLAESIFGL